MNYYIIQVATGREQAFIDNLNKLTPQLAQAHTMDLSFEDIEKKG